MFYLTEKPIDTLALRRHLDSTQLGGIVIFEGVVRDRHDDRTVRHLHYEAAEPLVAPVFEAIAAEGIRRHGPATIAAAHRVGILVPGETAVWIGVATPHRTAAFDLCRFLIDTIKEQLPVWKKEVYTDGEGHWVNSP
ncbi:MAG TPA: molybdenum cofactor biosynthesis protein MoaE [Kiritimatiellia bacterium]|nr:molybdenum cofactor biosynthesis protein MoaE [Kiritimatiellia bacterium]